MPIRLAPAIAILLCIGSSSLLAQFAQEPIDLLLDGGTVVTMDPARHIITDAAIAIRGDSIVAIGSRKDIDPRYAPAHRPSTVGQLILPGLINGHTHAAMTLFRGLGDDQPLHEWLQNYIFPAEARNVDADFVPLGHPPGCARDDPRG